MKLQHVTTTRLVALLLPVVLLASASQTYALSLLGEEVTGVFNIGASSTNLYDPDNGLVPDNTYGNSNNTPGNGTNIVPIADPLVEFGYLGTSSMALFTANFTGAGAVILTATSVPFMSVTQTFSSTAFAGLQFTGTIIAANNSCSFANITVTCSAISGPGFTSEYQFSAPVQTPEPASLTLLALGLTGIIARCRKRA